MHEQISFNLLFYTLVSTIKFFALIFAVFNMKTLQQEAAVQFFR